jgi:hypothetical protein
VSKLVSELVSQFVRRLLQESHCELLLLEVVCRGTGIIREPEGSGTSAVASRYQATASKNVAVNTSLSVTVI